MAGHGRFGGHFVQVRVLPLRFPRALRRRTPHRGRTRPGHSHRAAEHLRILQEYELTLLLRLSLPLQGHVDTTATILSITPDGDSLRYLFSLPLAFFTPMIPKGYVALDGTSLTLTSLARPPADDPHYRAGCGTFGVMLIAHTQSRTVVAMKAVGDSVNVEVDVVGKGVESIVRNVLEGGEGGAMEAMIERAVERVLAKKGLV